ncbi:MAG: DNA cytosine methyltransferase [Armatimonadetes bacterium]|nr:DNA cytosine methyltransferase [Armatimonadota bacterium]
MAARTDYNTPVNPENASTNQLRKRVRVIDLFCGAGGLTEGFARCPSMDFRPVWANDFEAAATRTYNANFGQHCVHGDICDILSDPGFALPAADLVIGGPPCQGFSLLNKNRAGDPRKQLWRPFLDVVARVEASLFVMENVPQLLGSTEFCEIQDVARGLGFQLASAKLCAADYGVPQTRTRAFIIGCAFADPRSVFPPAPTHIVPVELRRGNAPKAAQGSLFEESECPTWPRWRCVRDAISDLDPPEGTEPRGVPPPYDLHFGRTPTAVSMARYRAIPDEGMNRVDLLARAPELTPGCWVRKESGGTDLFGRLWWDRPSVTIRTEFYKPEKGRYLHPEQHRPITHREAARLQSFPDGFAFVGSKIEIARQIGNAVPPLLAAAVAECVAALIAGAYTKHGRYLRLSEAKQHYVSDQAEESA